MVNQVVSDLREGNEQLRQRVAELEDELRHTRLRLEELDQLYHTAPIGLCLMDRELRFVRINAQLAAINGLPIKDHIGATLSDVLPDLARNIEPLYRQVLETGDPVLDIEITGTTPAHPHNLGHFLVSYFPVMGGREQVVGVSTVVQDITEVKHAEQELQESESRLRTIVDHAPEAIVLLDVESGKFVDANENAERLFGVDRDTLLTMGPIEMSPPTQPDGVDSKQFGRRVVQQTLDGQAPVFEWTHRNARGQDIPCEIRLVRMPYAGRSLIRGSITDISERIEAQRALEQANDQLEQRVADRTAALAASEERWRSLVATAPDIILIVDLDGKIRYINRTEPGYDIDAVIGTSAFDFVRAKDRPAMRTCYENVMRTGEIHTLDATVDGPDGTVTYYSSRVGPFVENGKIVGVTSIATDVTEKKIAEEKLIAEDRLLRQLLDLQETERKMVAYDIHDGFVQDVVGAQMRVEGARGLSDVDEIKGSLDSVSQILRRGISEGRRLIRDLRPMVLDEAGVIEAIRHLVADEKKHGQLDAIFTHDVEFDRLEPMLEGAIFRIVQESLTNIKKHAQTDDATVSLIERDHVLHIEVDDQGCGFVLTEVPSDRFGLRGVQERARLFGGTAKIDTTPGRGTCVNVELPLEA